MKAATFSNRAEESADRLRVLVVEADRGMVGQYAAALLASDMEVAAVGTEAAARHLFGAFRPRVVLLGLPLPNSDELDLVRALAATGGCGLIVAAETEDDSVASLEAGADDFITKPVSTENLVARVRAIARRMPRNAAYPAAMFQDTIEPDAPEGPVITVDATHRRLLGPTGENTHLTEAELSVLETLLGANGASVSREQIGHVALHRLIRIDDRSVDQLVLKLRRKLTAQGASKRTILSSRREGYMIPKPTMFRATRPSSS